MLQTGAMGVSQVLRIHYTFAMELRELEVAFARVRESGIAYGESPFARNNMRITMGDRGQGKAVYFDDPDAHLLEIKHYWPSTAVVGMCGREVG